MKKVIFLFFPFFFLVGCSVMQKHTFSKIDKNESVVILPFKNLSETPYAGVKASLVAEGVLRSKGYKVYRGYKLVNDKPILSNEANASYLLTGRVIEWKYKTGIDGEPAVSVYVELKDRNGSVLFSSVSARSDLGHKSLGIVAEEIFEGIF